MKIVILAAGIGSRLGNPLPKPLTELKNGKSIMQHQIDNVSKYFNPDNVVTCCGLQERSYNGAFSGFNIFIISRYDQTNTSKSLLLALRNSQVMGYCG